MWRLGTAQPRLTTSGRRRLGGRFSACALAERVRTRKVISPSKSSTTCWPRLDVVEPTLNAFRGAPIADGRQGAAAVRPGGPPSCGGDALGRAAWRFRSPSRDIQAVAGFSDAARLGGCPIPPRPLPTPWQLPGLTRRGRHHRRQDGDDRGRAGTAVGEKPADRCDAKSVAHRPDAGRLILGLRRRSRRPVAVRCTLAPMAAGLGPPCRRHFLRAALSASRPDVRNGSHTYRHPITACSRTFGADRARDCRRCGN